MVWICGFIVSMKKFSVDLHQIELRFEHLRIPNQGNLRRLLESIAIYGQLEPLAVVQEKDNAYILIDGYQRYTVLKIIGKDLAEVAISDIKEDRALIKLLRRDGGRKWAILEEAGVIQHLHRQLELSLAKIAEELGRNKSYIKRRLDLIENLPEKTLELVMSGAISVWSANRVIIPLARANPHNVDNLITYLKKVPTTTRKLKLFYEHYHKSSRVVRNRMLSDPELFFRTHKSIFENTETTPEEKWIRDAKVVCGILSRLVEQIDQVLFTEQNRGIKKQLKRRATNISVLSIDLQKRIEEKMEYEKANKERGDTGNDTRGSLPENYCKAVESIPKHNSESDQLTK